jgi:lipopolysaccharide export system protein LptA
MLTGDVQLKHENSLMYCDSAYINMETNNLEAFGNVHIIQPGGTEGFSDYLRYTGKQRLAYMSGNVSLTDGDDYLWSDEVEYNMQTKIGTYTKGGTLQSGTTIVNSMACVYNMRSKDARFTINVKVNDPQYDIVSQDLGYNTDTKITTFFSPSIVTSDSSVVNTSCGTYNTQMKVAHLPCRSSVLNKEQYIEGDTLDYNKQTGYGVAIGNVIAIDTLQRTTLYSGRADYNEKLKTMLATIKPVLKQMNGDDSLFIRADTFFSAPIKRVNPDTTKTASIPGRRLQRGKSIMTDSTDYFALGGLRSYKMRDTIVIWRKVQNNVPVEISRDTLAGTRVVKPGITTATKNTPADTVKAKPKALTDTLVVGARNDLSKRKKRADTSTIVKVADTVDADSNAPRYFIGYHHVLIFSDSLQGRCDSISYSQEDSVMRMMIDPVAWSRNSQITGDTILLYVDSSNKLRKIYVPNNAFMVSQSGPPKAKLFDQVQGKTLTGFFVNNAINNMIVRPNSEVIYYSMDDSGAYIGVNEVTSEITKIYFKDQAIDRIYFEQDVKHKMTPLDKANLPGMKLSRYRWLDAIRPRSLEELFR